MKHPDAKPPFMQPDKGRCRWCWGAVPKGRRSWCSDACVNEYREETDWNFIRAIVEKRDRGICWFCETDTRWVCEAVQALRMGNPEFWNGTELRPSRIAPGKMVPFPRWKILRRELIGGYFGDWEADHIQARADGGADHPKNLRTLCIGCHKQRTKKQAGERAQRRRDAKASLFNGASDETCRSHDGSE